MVICNINLDLAKENFAQFKCKQNDDITLKFNIFNNSMLENMTGATVILNALKSDNTFVKQSENITVANNTININCLRDITRVGGIVKLELVIIKDNKQKTTFNIDVNVVNSIITSNVEASKNVVSVIEELDTKIGQGKVIVKGVDDTKNSAIDAITNLKTETITIATKIKEDTIKQFNATTEEVKALKDQTITQSTAIKNSAISELSKIKTDSIAALEVIKADSIKALNSIKDTANIDLSKVKTDTIAEVTRVANEAIASINKYNIQDVSKKIDAHIADSTLHVTKALTDKVSTIETNLKSNTDAITNVDSKIGIVNQKVTTLENNSATKQELNSSLTSMQTSISKIPQIKWGTDAASTTNTPLNGIYIQV